MSEALSGAEFKKQLRAGKPKLGLFVNSHSPTVARDSSSPSRHRRSSWTWILTAQSHLLSAHHLPERRQRRLPPSLAKHTGYA